MTAATAIAHPNFALVKYWGKQAVAGNVPAMPSLSITLEALETRTRVAATAKPSLFLDGQYVEDAKVQALVAALTDAYGLPPLAIDSGSNFPAGAGLASSASGIAALVTAVDAAFGLALSPAERSQWARRGSASAARSMFGGFATLTASADWAGSQLLDGSEWPLEVVVAIAARAPKRVSSTAGMAASQATSPYYDAWLATAEADFAAGCEAVRQRDFAALASVAEHSCLKMHGLMLSSRPPLAYWNGATVSAMASVRELAAKGVPVFFTIDAGPQLKAVCAPGHGTTVAHNLRHTWGVMDVFVSGLGPGARAVPANV